MKMQVEELFNQNVIVLLLQMRRALQMSLRVQMDVAFKSAGFAMAKMIAATNRMRVTTAPEPPVRPIPTLTVETVAFLINGAVMEMLTAPMDLTRW